MELSLIFLRTLLVLAGVSALAYASLRWGLKRFTDAHQDPNPRIEIQERLVLGPKRQILLLRIEGEQILVGSSEAGLQKLHHLESPETSSLQKPSTSNRPSRKT